MAQASDLAGETGRLSAWCASVGDRAAAKLHAWSCTDIFYVRCHFLLAALFFLPFFLRGYILLGNTDVTDDLATMVFLQMRALSEGYLPLWLPYQMGGQPLAFYSNNHALSLENIAVFFFVGEKYAFLAYTFLAFLKLSLVGAFAYHTFLCELKSRRWSFFAALSYQFCLFTFFSAALLDLFTFWLLFTVALYLIWSLERRRTLANYIMLLVVLLQMMMPNHVVYGIYALAMLGIVFCYRFLSVRQLRGPAFVAVGASLATAALIFFGLRVLPVLIELQGSAQIATLSFQPMTRGFLALRLFNAEMFGFNFRSAGEAANSVSPLLRVNLHSMMPQYFGVIPALLALLAIFSLGNTKKRFWAVLVLIIVASLLVIQPIEMIYAVGLFPLPHDLGLANLLPFPACMLAGLTAQQIERQPRAARQLSPAIFCSVIFLGLLMTAWWVFYDPRLLHRPFQALLIAGTVLFVAGLAVHKKLAATSVWAPAWQWLSGNAIQTTLLVFGAACVAFAAAWWTIDPHRFGTTQTLYMHVWFLLGATTLVILFTLAVRSAPRSWQNTARLTVAVVSAFYLVAIFSYVPAEDFPIDTPKALSAISAAGLLRFTAVGLVLASSVHCLSNSQIRRNHFFVVVIFAHVLDLLPSFKIHSVLSTNPFFNASTIYPKEDRLFDASLESKLDLQSYRFNSPNMMLGVPFFERYYNSAHAVTLPFQIYGIRSAGGHLSGRDRWYIELVHGLMTRQFGRVPPGFEKFFMNPPGERLLDILGVGYDYNQIQQAVVVRPSALARIMLYESYRVAANDQQVLDILASPEFDPQKQLIVTSTAPSDMRDAGGVAKKLPYRSLSSDEILVNVESENGGILLFNDTFNKGWIAKINNVAAPVVRVNYAFMAVAVPPGQSLVHFSFRPQHVVVGRWIAMAGAALIVLTTILMIRATPSPVFGSRKAVSVLTAHARAFRWDYTVIVILFAIAICQGTWNYQDLVQERRTVRIATVAPNGAAASSLLAPTYSPDRWFRGETIWHAQSPPQYPEWLQVNYPSPVVVRSLSLLAQDRHPERAPSSFALVGSNDGNHWHTLLEVRSDSWARETAHIKRPQAKTWRIDKPDAFLHYRLVIFANSGDSSFLTVQSMTLGE